MTIMTILTNMAIMLPIMMMTMAVLVLEIWNFKNNFPEQSKFVKRSQPRIIVNIARTVLDKNWVQHVATGFSILK